MATIPVTSVALLKAIANDSNSKRWTDFYARYQPAMEAYIRKVFPSLEAEEIIQEAMVALIKKLPEYVYEPDEKGHFRNYLLGVVKYKALEALKKRKREVEKLDRSKNDPTVDAPCDDDPEAREWRHAAYEAALAQLMADTRISERNRCVFVRVAINDESPDAVAKIYKITRNNVDQIKNRMISKLRDIVTRMIELE